MLSEMNGRERVLAALEHREPDRVPFDLGGSLVSGIHRNAYIRLLNRLDVKEEVSILDPLQQLARVSEQVKQALSVDVEGVGGRDPKLWKAEITEGRKGTCYVDAWGIRRIMPQGALYFDRYFPPLAEATSIKDIEPYPWPAPEDFLEFEALKREVRRAHETGRAVVLQLGGETIGKAIALLGLERFYTGLVRHPKFVLAVVDKVLECKMALWEYVLKEVADLVDVVVEADDLGAQDRPLMSPVMYRRYLKPRQKKLFEFIHRLVPKAKLFYHTDGAVYDLIPDLLEIGVEILNPVQVDAVGMEPQRLKVEFGKDLVFWGAGPQTKTLSHGSPREVRDEVRRRIEVLAPGGGIVLAPIHNIQAEVPPENVLAMYEALREFG